MNNRPSQWYECINKGHQDPDRAFEAAPAAWFLSKNLSLPVHCPACKQWRNAQKDERVRCQDCKRVMNIPARFKIAYHKDTGPFVAPKWCNECAKGERKPKSARDFNQAFRTRVVREHDNSDVFDLLGNQGTNVFAIELLLMPEDYEHDATYKGSEREYAEWRNKMRHETSNNQVKRLDQTMTKSGFWLVETRREHIERHLPGSPFFDSEKSPTSLSGSGQFAELLTALAENMRETDTTKVRQFRAGNDRLVRLTHTGGREVELTFLQPRAYGQYEVVTTYCPHDAVSDALENIANGIWRS